MLDNVIDRWNQDNNKHKHSKYDFANSIGIAFGHYLIKNYRMKWKLITDEQGTDYAVTRRDLTLSAFPINSVIKAVEEKREVSLNTISLIIDKQIHQIQKRK